MKKLIWLILLLIMCDTIENSTEKNDETNTLIIKEVIIEILGVNDVVMPWSYEINLDENKLNWVWYSDSSFDDSSQVVSGYYHFNNDGEIEDVCWEKISWSDSEKYVSLYKNKKYYKGFILTDNDTTNITEVDAFNNCVYNKFEKTNYDSMGNTIKLGLVEYKIENKYNENNLLVSQHIVGDTVDVNVEYSYDSVSAEIRDLIGDDVILQRPIPYGGFGNFGEGEQVIRRFKNGSTKDFYNFSEIDSSIIYVKTSVSENYNFVSYQYFNGNGEEDGWKQIRVFGDIIYNYDNGEISIQRY